MFATQKLLLYFVFLLVPRICLSFLLVKISKNLLKPTICFSQLIDINALPDSKRRLEAASQKVATFLSQDSMNVVRLAQAVRDMESESAQTGFWDDGSRAQTLLGELTRTKALLDRARRWQSAAEEAQAMIDIVVDNADEAGNTQSLIYLRPLTHL